MPPYEVRTLPLQYDTDETADDRSPERQSLRGYLPLDQSGRASPKKLEPCIQPTETRGLSQLQITMEGHYVKNPFPNRTSHHIWKLQWMLGAPRTLVTKPPVNKLPPKKITLIHDEGKKTKHTAALTTHVEEFVEAEGLMMPPHEASSGKDPRDFESSE